MSFPEPDVERDRSSVENHPPVYECPSMPELVDFYGQQPGSHGSAYTENNNNDSVPNHNNNNSNSESNGVTVVDMKPDVNGINGPPSASVSPNTNSYLEGKSSLYSTFIVF